MRRRIKRALIGIFVFIVVPGIALSSCVGSPMYYTAKFSPAGSPRPAASPVALVPEVQVEPHTCGFHSLSSLYKAYGLDAQRLRLRFRVGVDKPVSLLFPSSRGTIHPDMLRVLHQDGFATDVVRPSAADAAERITRHLNDGHYAITLIDVGALHWVVLGAGSELGEGRVQVCDSLYEDKYLETLDAYLVESVYSIVLVKPQ